MCFILKAKQLNFVEAVLGAYGIGCAQVKECSPVLKVSKFSEQTIADEVLVGTSVHFTAQQTNLLHSKVSSSTHARQLGWYRLIYYAVEEYK